MTAIVVRVEHVRRACFCMAGLRVWLARHDLDLLQMIRSGIPIERLEATGDALALRVCAIARADAEVRDGR
jgi:hypothetical protein